MIQKLWSLQLFEKLHVFEKLLIASIFQVEKFLEVYSSYKAFWFLLDEISDELQVQRVKVKNNASNAAILMRRQNMYGVLLLHSDLEIFCPTKWYTSNCIWYQKVSYNLSLNGFFLFSSHVPKSDLRINCKF